MLIAILSYVMAFVTRFISLAIYTGFTAVFFKNTRWYDHLVVFMFSWLLTELICFPVFPLVIRPDANVERLARQHRLAVGCANEQ